jgi:UDP-GlcNAc3NAcA epimerase
VLATIHRAENTDDDDRLRDVLRWLEARAREVPVVFPVHPRTAGRIRTLGLTLAGVILCEPVGYIDMARLLGGAVTVCTDSGGLQKEAYFHRVPCVTLREETEWTETVSSGWNRLWRGPDYITPRNDIADYGDGHAAAQVVRRIRDHFGA